LHPISFSIPDQFIAQSVPSKNKTLCDAIPGNLSTYFKVLYSVFANTILCYNCNTSNTTGGIGVSQRLRRKFIRLDDKKIRVGLF
jgi:hypothetical protein